MLAMIILIGPSASGKTEIAKILIKDYGFKKFVTTTTRSPRLNEINDMDYHFISINDFNNKISNKKFIEYVFYNDNYYGTTLEEIDDNKVLILEPKGLKEFLKLNDKNIVSFYIDASKETRYKRMVERKDKEEEILKRIHNDDKYFAESKKDVDYIIDNNSNETSLNKIAAQIYTLYINKIK